MIEKKESYFEHLKKSILNNLELLSDLSFSFLPFLICTAVGFNLMNFTDNVDYLFGSMGLGVVMSVIFIDYVTYKKRNDIMNITRKEVEELKELFIRRFTRLALFFIFAFYFWVISHSNCSDVSLWLKSINVSIIAFGLVWLLDRWLYGVK
jgi:hypothetical protein